MATLEIWEGGRSKRKDFNIFERIERYSGMNDLGPFSPDSMKFTKSGFYSEYTQTGNITLSARGGSIMDGVGQVAKFISNGTGTITLGSDFDTTAIYGITSGGTLSSGTYWFYMLGVGGKIHINVKQAG